MSSEVVGKIHSYQSLGTVDGPGVRFVIFTQGCPLRCGCCHNPDTWDIDGGTRVTARQAFSNAIKYKPYFGEKGGITISGGEPLIQSEFCLEVFKLCTENGINTCLDTSGCILNSSIKELLKYTDRVLLDVKYLSEEKYQKFVKTDLQKVLDFLAYLNEQSIKVTIRQVVIPTLNDTVQEIKALNNLANAYKVVDKIELLPFRKICATKYKEMGLEFKFNVYDTPTSQDIERLYLLIDEKYKKEY